MKITGETWESVYRAPKISRDTMELRGYECIEELFADSSGFGMDSEPALSVRQFPDAVKSILEKHGPLYVTITNVGQFQVYVGFFKKTGKSRAEKIGVATYRIEHDNGYAIRYHDTDVFTFHNGKITLDSGGWYTKTTKERINTALYDAGAQFWIIQHDYKWYVVPRGTLLRTKAERAAALKFSDGMTLPVTA